MPEVLINWGFGALEAISQPFIDALVVGVHTRGSVAASFPSEKSVVESRKLSRLFILSNLPD